MRHNTEIKPVSMDFHRMLGALYSLDHHITPSQIIKKSLPKTLGFFYVLASPVVNFDF